MINDPTSDLSYMNNIVDQYGQYTKQTWDGKVTSDADLTSRATSEEATLDTQIQQIEDMNKYTQYGGWKNEALKQEATGRFYVKKVDGKWTYIDPEGYPFISTGLDIIRLGDSLTWISGRNGDNANNISLFQDLPSKTGPLGDHYTTVTSAKPPYGLSSGDGFNFYSANLERKYGQDWLTEWTETTIKRFKARNNFV